MVLDTDSVDPLDRAEYVHEAMRATMVSVEWQWLDDAPAVAHGLISRLGDLTVCSGNTSARRVERTPALSRDGAEPTVFVNLQIAGTSAVVQGGREATLRPGAMAMYDSSAPYTLLSNEGMAGEFFQIAHSALALPTDVIRRACAAPLAPQHPLTSLTFEHLRRLTSDPRLFTTPRADLAAQPHIDLLRAVIMTHLGAADRAAEPLANTLCMRILDYAARRLRDPDLNAESIAAANFVSVRQLYKVLADADISLSEWIRTRRLERARYDLAQGPPTVTIASIARRNGFTDMSSFSRAFRAEYGASPRQWRAHHASAGASASGTTR
ncbi:helix-turn-helix domain-containing protein [Mycolicibacterium cosmeticum]|uniref:helix-turn-helix domain-containing protein n=1 Tax=Mycolicibacterium cosmeticum TaxID=258533 RepID=UPI0032049F8F